MVPRLTDAVHVRDYVLRLRFADGVEGEIDLGNELNGEVFLPLREPGYFRRFAVHPELHTLVWPNGADFAPEWLHEKIAVRPGRR